jgi:hypothetical protein
MNFWALLKREWLWWGKSPALWWSFPPLLLMLSLQIQIAWWASGLKVVELEGLWRYMGMGWNIYGKQMLQNNTMLMMALGDRFDAIEALIKMSPEEVWQVYILPPLQLFCLLPLPVLLPPLAVTLFRRDVQSGMLKMFVLNGGKPLNFLLAKFFSAAFLLLPLQCVCAWISMSLFIEGSGRGEFFDLSSQSWLLAWFGAGFGMGLWVLVMSWLVSLVSKNGATEVYSSMVVTSGALSLSLLAYKYGQAEGFLFRLSAILYVSIIPMLLLLWLRIRSRSYHMN